MRCGRAPHPPTHPPTHTHANPRLPTAPPPPPPAPCPAPTCPHLLRPQAAATPRSGSGTGAWGSAAWACLAAWTPPATGRTRTQRPSRRWTRRATCWCHPVSPHQITHIMSHYGMTWRWPPRWWAPYSRLKTPLAPMIGHRHNHRMCPCGWRPPGAGNVPCTRAWWWSRCDDTCGATVRGAEAACGSRTCTTCQPTAPTAKLPPDQPPQLPTAAVDGYLCFWDLRALGSATVPPGQSGPVVGPVLRMQVRRGSGCR